MDLCGCKYSFYHIRHFTRVTQYTCLLPPRIQRNCLATRSKCVSRDSKNMKKKIAKNYCRNLFRFSSKSEQNKFGNKRQGGLTPPLGPERFWVESPWPTGNRVSLVRFFESGSQKFLGPNVLRILSTKLTIPQKIKISH